MGNYNGLRDYTIDFTHKDETLTGIVRDKVQSCQNYGYAVDAYVVQKRDGSVTIVLPENIIKIHP